MDYRKIGSALNGLPAENGIPGCPEPDAFRDGKALSLFLGQTIPVTDKEGDVLFSYMERAWLRIGLHRG